MTGDPNDEAHNVTHHATEDDPRDAALDALLRRADRDAPPAASGDLESRILSAAEFPLAARRRDARVGARNGTTDTLAAWMRIALPLAAAAALFATFSLTRADSTPLTTVAEAELTDSDPAALLSAMESAGSSDLARRVITSDASNSIGYDLESR